MSVAVDFSTFQYPWRAKFPRARMDIRYFSPATAGKCYFLLDLARKQG
jgi:hypothetical protein